MNDVPPGFRHITLRCIGLGCRVQTFIGTYTVPLNACPVCQSAGIATEVAK